MVAKVEGREALGRSCWLHASRPRGRFRPLRPPSSQQPRRPSSLRIDAIMASATASTSGPSRLASPLAPPPLYALVMPELHRCSAIGLEEALNEAWADEEAASRRHQQHTASHTGSESSSHHHRQDRSSSGDSNETSSRHHHHPHRSQTGGYPIAPSISPPLPDSSLPPLLAFLQSLSLRTLVYLSPSLLPCALVKLAHQLDLNLVQWDLTGPKVWRARSNADDGEVRTLRRFAAASRRVNGKKRSNGSTPAMGSGRADDTLMILSLLSLLLTASTSPALVCDPSGLAQTSLVVGCLRRMMRRSFASICVDYRAFAASAPVSAARTTPGQLPSTASALRFIEVSPLRQDV